MNARYTVALIIGSLSAAGVAYAQDRWTLRSPSGIAFAEVKGYESWDVIGSSMPDDESGCGTSKAPGCIKSIVGNPVLIQAYKDGIPKNGKQVPDGAAFAKIEWAKARDEHSPYGAFVPRELAEVAFMLKDSKRFPKTNGWGYATFQYDSATDSWKTKGENPDFVLACHACHTVVRDNDYVFTAYRKR